MLSSDSNKSTSNYYTCKTCGSLFTCLDYYHQHRKGHVEKEGVTLYTCSHCTYISDNTFHFNWHIMSHASQPPHKCAVCHPGYNEEEAAAAVVNDAPNLTTTPSGSFSTNRVSRNNLAIYLPSIEEEDTNTIGDGIAEMVITFGKRTISTNTTEKHFDLAGQFYPLPSDDEDDDYDDEEGEEIEAESNADNQGNVPAREEDGDDDDAATIIDEEEAIEISQPTSEDIRPEERETQGEQGSNDENTNDGVDCNGFASSPESFTETNDQSVADQSNDPYDFNDDDDEVAMETNKSDCVPPAIATKTAAVRLLKPAEALTITTSSASSCIMQSHLVQQQSQHQQSQINCLPIQSHHHAQTTHALHNFQLAANNQAMFIQAPPPTAAAASQQQLQQLQTLSQAKAQPGQPITSLLTTAPPQPHHHQQQIMAPMATLLNNFTILPNGAALTNGSAAFTSNGNAIRLVPLGTSPTTVASNANIAPQAGGAVPFGTTTTNDGLSLTYQNGQPAMVSTQNPPPKGRGPKKRHVQPIEPNPNSAGIQAISLIDNYVPKKGLGKGNRKPRINVIHVINGVTVGADGVRRKFHCSHCGNGKSFKTKSHLQRHMLTHTGEKPYQCNECGAKFNQSSSLRNHKIAIHTRKFPHICFTCGKGFLMPAVLQKHCLQNGHKMIPMAGGPPGTPTSSGSLSQPGTPAGPAPAKDDTMNSFISESANHNLDRNIRTYQRHGDGSNGMDEEEEDEEDEDEYDDEEDDDDVNDGEEIALAAQQQTMVEQHQLYYRANTSANAGPGPGQASDSEVMKQNMLYMSS